MSFAIQLAGSFVAVLALAWLALRLRLGGDPRINSEDEARILADEALPGFEAVEVAIDRAGMGALCHDGQGRVMVLRRHGSHWASRVIDGRTTAWLDNGRLAVATEDRRFGTVTLDLGDEAPAWTTTLRRLAG